MKQHGIVTPMVTPLAGTDALDQEGLERLISRLLDGGVDGIFPLGSTGEAPSLSHSLRFELIQRVTEVVGGRVPVWVGISDTSFAATRALALAAADAGAAGVVLCAPYYYPLTPGELAAALESLIRDLPLPVMLYNIPSCTKVWLDVETLRRLAALDQVAGIKDSGGDLDYFSQITALRRERPDWFFMVGPARLLVEAMRRGADGGVCAASHMAPRLLVDCYHAMAAHDEERAEELQRLIQDVGNVCRIGEGMTGSIRGIKCVLSILGVCGERMAEPFFAPDESDRARLQDAWESLADRIAPFG
jgi:4-hydroxy-tetrahydrodipicolinate synthase